MARRLNIGILVAIFIPIIVLALYLAREESIFPFESEKSKRETIHIGSVPVFVSIVDTPEGRARGLSGRLPGSLNVNDGLLLVFEESGAHGIWMREMQFPIDIIWISDGLRVVDIKENATPESFPEIFHPRVNARYVLEVNALFTEVRGIQIGDEVLFPERLSP